MMHNYYHSKGLILYMLFMTRSCLCIFIHKYLINKTHTYFLHIFKTFLKQISLPLISDILHVQLCQVLVLVLLLKGALRSKLAADIKKKQHRHKPNLHVVSNPYFALDIIHAITVNHQQHTHFFPVQFIQINFCYMRSQSIRAFNTKVLITIRCRSALLFFYVLKTESDSCHLLCLKRPGRSPILNPQFSS